MISVKPHAHSCINFISLIISHFADLVVAPTGATGVSRIVDWSPESCPWFSASAFLCGSLAGVSLPAILASAMSAAVTVLSPKWKEIFHRTIQDSKLKILTCCRWTHDCVFFIAASKNIVVVSSQLDSARYHPLSSSRPHSLSVDVFTFSSLFRWYVWISRFLLCLFGKMRIEMKKIVCCKNSNLFELIRIRYIVN